MKYYSLHARSYGSGEPFYLVQEILSDKRKRTTILSGKTNKELDDLTSRFSSFSEINEAFNDIYNTNLELYDPMIIVEDSLKPSVASAIYDIVYKDDKSKIDNIDGIKLWLLEYLKQNPYDIDKFIGMRQIIRNINSDYFFNDRLIDQVVFAYFSNCNYKKVRDTYFSLKKLVRK